MSATELDKWGVISDGGIEHAAELLGTKLRRERFGWLTEVTRDAIQHFAEGIGDRNPLYRDPEYGTTTRWKTMLAPPTILFAFDNTVVAPRLPGVQWIYGGVEWVFHDVIRRGDIIEPETWFDRQVEKRGEFSSRWLLQSGHNKYTRASDGVLVGEAWGHTARTPRGDALKKEGRTKYQPRGQHRYSSEEIEKIENEILAHPQRGAETRYFEDVEIGEALPPAIRGPLNSTDMIAFYSGTIGARTYGGAHADAIHYRTRHADFDVSSTTGTKDTPGRGHMEADTGRDVGMGGAYDSGIQRICWGGTVLTDWMSDDGFLHKLSARLKRPNLFGDVTWWHGTVTSRSINDGYPEVEVELKAVNQLGDVTATGRATVILPSRNGDPLSFPIRKSNSG